MDITISQGLKKIKNKLESYDNQSFKLTVSQSLKKTKLEKARYLLQRFVEYCQSAEDDRIHLFRRQLNRLMNSNNNSLPSDFWIELRKDIVYILGENEHPQKTAFKGTFLRRMEFEKELEQREFKSRENLKQKKTLEEFLNDHKQFFDVYLQNCISFHSKLEVMNLYDNMNKFSKDFDIDLEISNRLEDDLKCFNIEYDCSDLRLDVYFDNKSLTNIIADINNYLPSKDKKLEVDGGSYTTALYNLLEEHRWLVILGDPGNSKTTILRRITFKFAETVKNGHFFFEDIRVRIPILIRIGEFATWLERNQSKTLIDYIGKHSWFSKPYFSDEEKDGPDILKELIHQGHALILLDGLDEISAVQQIGDIVQHIENFIKEYVMASDFISAFDEKFLSVLTETERPGKSTGNQIFITSRILNYRFSLIKGPFIQHCALSLIECYKAKPLVKKWIKQILKSINNILNEKQIQFNEDRVEKLFNERFEKVFKTKLELLHSNTSLLFLICKLIFQSNEIYSLQNRTDIYRRTMEIELQSWTKHNSTISINTISYFLSQLACYLHLHSSSGLIDEFNFQQLCCLILKQENVSTNHKELHMHVESIIVWLRTNVGIAMERALNIYSFIHLSFQEYFVAMGFADFERFSIEENVKRIVSFTIHPRFRESLLFVMSLISWKLSSEEYDKFCELLFTTTLNHMIPFGIILFFDSISELYKLPSNEIIFHGLNILFHHSCYSFSKKCFMSSLLTLPQKYIEKWIDVYIHDEESMRKFGKLFIFAYDCYWDTSSFKFSSQQSFPSIIYEKMRPLYIRYLSDEFFVDQILHRTYGVVSYTNDIDNQSSKIHPLIIAVMIGLIGHLDWFLRERNIDFTTFYLQSSVFSSIKSTYFDNQTESDSVKIENLIRELNNNLEERCSIEDISRDTIEIFIALICLQGVSQPLNYEKYSQYKALPLALDQFKRIYFYWKQFVICKCSYHPSHIGIFINFGIQSLMNDLTSQSFSVACVSTAKKLGFYNWMHSNDSKEYSFVNPNFSYVRLKEILTTIFRNNHLNKNLLSFLPQSLQKLFDYIIFLSNDRLSPVIFLVQCLINLEDVNHQNDYFILAFPILSHFFQENKLENYASVLFHDKYSHMMNNLKERMNMNDLFVKNEIKDYEKIIEIERERIDKAIETKNDEQLFAASISLARILQTQHKDEVISSIENISNEILRVIAFSIVLQMKDPLVFDEEQRDNIRNKIIVMLKDLLPRNSLIISSLLFIQCHSLRQIFREDFQILSHIIGTKFLEESNRSEQEAVYIALKQLNNPDISSYLFKFERETKNLSELLNFNSSIFYGYLNETTTSQRLLASMYFVELVFDCQILRMYIKTDQKEIFIFNQLSIDSSKSNKILTFTVAEWIDNYLQISSKQEDIEEIINQISQCEKIERKALSIMNKWLQYRKNKNLKFFAHYAAVQLVIYGSITSELTDIINERFNTNSKENILYSSLIKSDNFGKLLIELKKNSYFISLISLTVNRQDLLEIILDLEFKRIISNGSQSTRSFLLMIKSISKDLQDFLIQHLQQRNSTNLEYVNVVIKRLIEISTSYTDKEKYPEKLYDYLLLSIDQNQQKIVLHSFYSIFQHRQEIIFLDKIRNFAEEMICSWTKHEDIIDIALLIYGNCLLYLKGVQMSEKVTEALKEILKYSFSERFIRVCICLTTVDDNHLLMEWFKYDEKQKYKILLELELYCSKPMPSIIERIDNEIQALYGSYTGKGKDAEKRIYNYLLVYRDKLLPQFVNDLHSFLCTKNEYSIIVDIAVQLIKDNRSEFFYAIQRSSYNENQLRTELQFYCRSNPNDCRTAIELHGALGVLTVEFLDIFEGFYNNDDEFEHSIVLYGFKQILNQAAIAKLFKLIQSATTSKKQRIYLSILSSIFRHDQVSLVEIHQQLQLVDDVSLNIEHEQQIVNLLLEFTRIKNSEQIHTEKIFNENDIERMYRSDLDHIDRNSNSFSQNGLPFELILFQNIVFLLS